jgi:hypothetical protein
VIVEISIPLENPIKIETKIKARNGESLTQVINKISSRMPIRRIMKDIIEMIS